MLFRSSIVNRTLTSNFFLGGGSCAYVDVCWLTRVVLRKYIPSDFRVVVAFANTGMFHGGLGSW